MRTVYNFSKLVIATLFLSIFTGCGSSGGGGAGDSVTPEIPTIDHNFVFFTSCFTPCSNYLLFKYSLDDEVTTQVGAGVLTDINYGYNGGQASNIVMDEKIYFSASDGINGVEFWVYDPRVAEQAGENPKMVMDIEPGASASYPYNFINHSGKIYFNAETSAEGSELWVYDPKEAVANGQNPKMVFDINPGSNGFDPRYLTVLDSKIYMRGSDGSLGSELWVYDPAVAASITNPQLVKDIYVGSNSSGPRNFFAAKGKLYFRAYELTNGSEPWVYDPSIAVSGSNPQLIYDMVAGTGGSSFAEASIIGDKIYFSGSTAATGDEIFVFDTTQTASASNPSLVYDIGAGVIDSSPEYLEVHNGKLYFKADTTANGEELYEYDPSIAASATNPKLYDINTGTADSNLHAILSFTDKLFIGTYITVGNLGLFDPTQAFAPGTNPSSIDPTIYNDYVYDLLPYTYTTLVTE